MIPLPWHRRCYSSGLSTIESVGERNDLVVGAVLSGLFKTTMQIANLVDVGHDGLAVKRRQDADCTMGGRMARPEVEIHDLGIDISHGGLTNAFYGQAGLDFLLKTVTLGADLPLLDGIVLPGMDASWNCQ